MQGWGGNGNSGNNPTSISLYGYSIITSIHSTQSVTTITVTKHTALPHYHITVISLPLHIPLFGVSTL